MAARTAPGDRRETVQRGGITVTIPYQSATSGDKALLEVEKILMKFGCAQFGHMQDIELGEIRLHFKWRDRMVDLRVSWRGYAAAFLKENPWNHQRKFNKEEWSEKALAQGKIAVCSILRDWIKAQVTAVEAGLMTFDAVFMPHMLLPDGSRLLDKAEKMLILTKQE